MATMTREEWNKAYAARMMERAGWTEAEALQYAECTDDSYDEGDDPSDSADEEMSCWDNDE